MCLDLIKQAGEANMVEVTLGLFLIFNFKLNNEGCHLRVASLVKVLL